MNRRAMFKSLALIPAVIVGAGQRQQPVSTTTVVANVQVDKQMLERLVKQAVIEAERRSAR